MKRANLEKLLDRFVDLYLDSNERFCNLRLTLWLLDNLDKDDRNYYESNIDKLEQNGDVSVLKGLCRNMLIALRTIISEAFVDRDKIASELKNELMRLAYEKSEDAKSLYRSIYEYVNDNPKKEDEGDGCN